MNFPRFLDILIKLLIKKFLSANIKKLKADTTQGDERLNKEFKKIGKF